MQYSYSGIDTFEKCKFKYQMRYVQGIKTDAPTEPDNPLILGTAIHTGIEKGLGKAIKKYCFSYPIITDEHINEIIKFKAVIPLAQKALPPGGSFEVEISDKDFHGFIDYLVPVGNGVKIDGIVDGSEFEDLTYFDIYDFKYSNNISSYEKSKQLHLYKYFFEKNNPGLKIRNLYFLFIPKVKIKPKKNETLSSFRRRLDEELSKAEVKKVQIKFNYEKVIDFLFDIKAINEETEFPKTESYLCRFCEFQEYCEKGYDYFMNLPENKRRNLEEVKKRVIWIYGAPFCGKTTFANAFPDPLMLNTDGNIKFVDAPFMRIKDDVRVEGRQTKRTFAWDIFKGTIDELEKKDNTFKTIIVDLLEDCYEHCRLYMYDQMGITHESDDSFRAWDKVRGEFLNTLKRLMNLDYENIILISHEDTTKDITRRGGDKITAIKPNLQEKVANKVAGMVDVVARIVADGEKRTFSFKSDEVIFGGGRLRVKAKDIPLDVNALFEVYDEANENAASGVVVSAEKPKRRSKTTDTSNKGTDSPDNTPEKEQAVNDTPKETPPKNSPEIAVEQPDEKEPEKGEAPEGSTDTPDNGDQNNSTPAAPTTPTETAEEKPRRRRKARE